jgi:nitroreductase
MVLKDLVKKNRSYRRFHEDVPLDEQTLRGLVDLARYSASGSNRQPLKFTLSWTPERNAKVFSTLAWAGALPDWPGPPEGERPTGYVIILGDTEISKGFGVDHGIGAQSILLGAVDIGLGGCMLAAIRRDDLRELLEIPEQYDILLAVALGKPKEKVVLETLEAGADHRYWRDADTVHHVPKRRLDDIIV